MLERTGMHERVAPGRASGRSRSIAVRVHRCSPLAVVTASFLTLLVGANLATPLYAVYRERFGFSPARYHQLLHRIVDGPHALEYDPMLVRRLRRIREIRRRRRTADRLGFRL